MIEYFLDPHPDEILYSVWARLSDVLHYQNEKDILRDLFGSNFTPMVDLPCHLGFFFHSLPSGHSYTLDALINKHTLYPLYAPFLPGDRLRRLQKQMISGNGLSLLRLIGQLGNASNSTTSPLWLRYCPTCVAEDRARYGECYWHRLHQVLGVEVCLKHNTLLEDSAVRTRAYYRIASSQFFPAERAVGSLHPETISGASSPTWFYDVQRIDSQRCIPQCFRGLLSNRTVVFVAMRDQANTSKRNDLVDRPHASVQLRSTSSPACAPDPLSWLHCRIDPRPGDTLSSTISRGTVAMSQSCVRALSSKTYPRMPGK